VPAEALTIHEASETTGWSPRMLRYIEEAGLVAPRRSPSGYRLYGPAELQRLRTLKELLGAFGIELSDVGFALRLRNEGRLRDGLEAWFSSKAVRPAEVDPGEWLAFEQRKHTQLLATAAGWDKEPVAKAAGWDKEPIAKAAGWDKEPVAKAAGWNKEIA
jgi:DNA-binding transcriptional MerR regulator